MVGASYRCRGISGATLGVRDCRRGVSVPARSHTVAVAHNEHPQHELRIDRRSPDIAVERRQVLAQLGQHPRHDRIDPSQQMTRRDQLFEVEQIK